MGGLGRCRNERDLGIKKNEGNRMESVGKGREGGNEGNGRDGVIIRRECSRKE